MAHQVRLPKLHSGTPAYRQHLQQGLQEIAAASSAARVVLPDIHDEAPRPDRMELCGMCDEAPTHACWVAGTGKTLLARAVAHHTDCTFIRVSGSELVQKYIGEGSRMVRELFVMARWGYSVYHQAAACLWA